MIISMTGFGRGEAEKKGRRASAEIRSVNNRFLETTVRLPKSLSAREKEVKDLLKGAIVRGTLNVSIKTESDKGPSGPTKVNVQAARTVTKMLNDLRKAAKLREPVRLEHLLTFSEVFEPVPEDETDEAEWAVARQALQAAVKDITAMRVKEGKALEKDIRKRIQAMAATIAEIESEAAKRMPEERARLRQRIAELVDDPAVVNEQRLELELAIMAERIDVTEECVRFRSHVEMFLSSMKDGEPSGRKLSFILQEMNRETNTIGSKVSDASIQHRVVSLKEELERVREQVQNVE